MEQQAWNAVSILTFSMKRLQLLDKVFTIAWNFFGYKLFKNCFISKKFDKLILQSWEKYARQTLVFISNSSVRKKINFCFSGVFC